MCVQKILRDRENQLSILRSSVAGFFVGISSLIPGIVESTMLITTGIYKEIINSLFLATKRKIERKNLIFISVFLFFFLATVFLLSCGVRFLMEGFSYAVYALIIGIIFGAIYNQIKKIRRFDLRGSLAIWVGFLIMLLVYFMSTIDQRIGSLLPYMIFTPIVIISLFFLGILASKWTKITSGFLIGILLGSLIGLYPFRMQDLSEVAKYKNQNNELILKVFGLGKTGRGEFLSNVSKLSKQNLKVIIDEQKGRIPTLEDVQMIREKSEILIIYGQSIPKEVRKAASDKKLGKIPLIIVSDTSFSMLRLLLSLILVVVGFFITHLLGNKEIQTQG